MSGQGLLASVALCVALCVAWPGLWALRELPRPHVVQEEEAAGGHDGGHDGAHDGAEPCEEYQHKLLPGRRCRVVATVALADHEQSCPDIFRCTREASDWRHQSEALTQQLLHLRDGLSELRETVRHQQHRGNLLQVQLEWAKRNASWQAQRWRDHEHRLAEALALLQVHGSLLHDARHQLHHDDGSRHQLHHNGTAPAGHAPGCRRQRHQSAHGTSYDPEHHPEHHSPHHPEHGASPHHSPHRTAHDPEHGASHHLEHGAAVHHSSHHPEHGASHHLEHGVASHHPEHRAPHHSPHRTPHDLEHGASHHLEHGAAVHHSSHHPEHGAPHHSPHRTAHDLEHGAASHHLEHGVASHHPEHGAPHHSPHRTAHDPEHGAASHHFPHGASSHHPEYGAASHHHHHHRQSQSPRVAPHGNPSHQHQQPPSSHHQGEAHHQSEVSSPQQQHHHQQQQHHHQQQQHHHQQQRHHQQQQRQQSLVGDACGGTRCPKDCASLHRSGERRSGVYSLMPVGGSGLTEPVDAYCDMETAGGGWTVIQRRLNGSVDFNRGWADYAAGFGSPHGELWLGNEAIHALSTQGDYSLRIDMRGWDGAQRHALYHSFRTSGEDELYALHVGGYSGTAEDSLAWYHDGRAFSTADTGGVCARIAHAGWWFHQCYYSNLNGVYYHGGDYESRARHLLGPDGVVWYTWTHSDYYSLRSVTMMLRPNNF
ncbi:uncharacterized protein LOC144953290 isoform X1 [Lampetra fluviatilis]